PRHLLTEPTMRFATKVAVVSTLLSAAALTAASCHSSSDDCEFTLTCDKYGTGTGGVGGMMASTSSRSATSTSSTSTTTTSSTSTNTSTTTSTTTTTTSTTSTTSSTTSSTSSTTSSTSSTTSSTSTGGCTGTDKDVDNCGACGRACSGANVVARSCKGGVCDS